MCCQGVYGLSFPRHDNDEFSALYLLTVETQKGERRLTELLSVGLFFSYREFMLYTIYTSQCADKLHMKASTELCLS